MLINAIKNRHSIRNYVEGGIVTDKQIKTLLEAAMLAPSACNSRPWKFLVITKRTKLDEIIDVHLFTHMLKTASAAIVVLADTTLQKDVSEGFFPQDCGAATQNILLQAAEMGLGTCWCGVYPKEPIVKQFKEIFNLPNHIVPFCCIALGVPNEQCDSRGFYEEEKIEWIN